MDRLPSQRLDASQTANIPADVSNLDRPSEPLSEQISESYTDEELHVARELRDQVGGSLARADVADIAKLRRMAETDRQVRP